MEKPTPTTSQFDKFVQLLLKNCREEKYSSNLEAIRDFVQSNSLTARQGVELMRFFKDRADYQTISSLILSVICDKHNRFALFQHYPESTTTNIRKCQRELGDAFNFTFWNPSGHYMLNLAHPQQREVAKCLILINRNVCEQITKNELRDRSQTGNKSCFRNEKHNGARFAWKPEWTLPKSGSFECDFVCLTTNRPTAQQETSPEQLSLLKAWFQQFGGAESKRKEQVDEEAMAEAFRGVAEYFAFSTEQLLQILDLFPGKRL